MFILFGQSWIEVVSGSFFFTEFNRRQDSSGMQQCSIELRIAIEITLETIKVAQCLVGGWPTPLKNISQLGWWHSQYMESHELHVPNHQSNVGMCLRDMQSMNATRMSNFMVTSTHWSPILRIEVHAFHTEHYLNSSSNTSESPIFTLKYPVKTHCYSSG